MLINASLVVMFTKNYARSCYADDGSVFLEGVVSEAAASLLGFLGFGCVCVCMNEGVGWPEHKT